MKKILNLTGNSTPLH